MALSDAPAIDDVRARAYRVPTDRPEADGTYAWHATTIVVVEVDAGPVTGLGYTYTDASAALLAKSMLADVLRERPLVDIPAAVHALWRAVRTTVRSRRSTATTPMRCCTRSSKAGSIRSSNPHGPAWIRARSSRSAC